MGKASQCKYFTLHVECKSAVDKQRFTAFYLVIVLIIYFAIEAAFNFTVRCQSSRELC